MEEVRAKKGLTPFTNLTGKPKNGKSLNPKIIKINLGKELIMFPKLFTSILLFLEAKILLILMIYGYLTLMEKLGMKLRFPSKNLNLHRGDFIPQYCETMNSS